MEKAPEGDAGARVKRSLLLATGSAQQPRFAARVSLDRTSMKIGDQIVPLRPGMAVTVEINAGERRIVDYLLSPLLRYTHESMRER